MVTIHDVAREAGVSRSTVSYALSGNRPISRETRDRIDDAIRRLGFTVNAGARALKTAQTMVIGLLLQFHEDEFPPAMLQYILAVTNAARAHGYDTLMVTDVDGAAAIRRVTSSNMVDGVILLDVTHDDPRLDALRAAPQPGALVGVPADAAALDVVDLDFRESARLLVDHLYGLGHRDIVLISPPRHVFDRGGAYAWRFREAALERAASYGITLSPYYGESQEPAIERSLNAILDVRPTATGLIVHNDASIAALPTVLRERNVRVPEDLSVVSLYARDFGRTFLLPYTAVETSPDQVGREAVQHLVRRIIDPEYAPPAITLIAPALTDRGSTA